MTTTAPARIVFIGINSHFSAVHLHALAGCRGQVSAVLETVGRISPLKRLQRRLQPSRLARMARAAGVPFQEIRHRDMSGLTLALRDRAPDLVVVAGMGWLLDKAALAVPRLGTLNVHPALLPAYRGAEPVFWQLFDGVPQSGVTVHLVDRREDHGPIVAQRSFPLPPGSSLSHFLRRIHELGPPLLSQAVDAVLAGTARPQAQPEVSPTRRARRLQPADRFLVDLEGWSLERTCQVLKGVGPVLGWPRPRWRDLGRVPVIEAAVPGEPGLPAGAASADSDGPFLAHPQGRIRFRRCWAPAAWLEAMRRGDRVASGIIATEKTAWPPLPGP
ncbi:methionyl-tRNA formyltransferase [Geminicoccus roseus]|uniref:methionyl-tRNA formyltransferase n=1 Tax=Geminicoccus roseus TaxID=404900 RepID=UPI000427EA58|nr:formyltransferase family protein [Geminicoccus roseus]